MRLKMLLMLLASSFLLSCKSVQDAPQVFSPTKLYDVDLDHGVCGEWPLKAIDPITYKQGVDLPLSKCNGLIGVKIEDMQRLIREVRALQEWAKKQR